MKTKKKPRALRLVEGNGEPVSFDTMQDEETRATVAMVRLHWAGVPAEEQQLVAELVALARQSGLAAGRYALSMANLILQTMDEPIPAPRLVEAR